MTMTVTQSVITIAAVVLGTMTTRFLPFLVFPEGREPPAFIRYLGASCPTRSSGCCSSTASRTRCSPRTTHCRS